FLRIDHLRRRHYGGLHLLPGGLCPLLHEKEPFGQIRRCEAGQTGRHHQHLFNAPLTRQRQRRGYHPDPFRQRDTARGPVFGAVVPYLKELGISHFYLSPIFKATPGSTHGYDINDHNQLNPEVTTREEYTRFAREATAAGMGIIVDFVPNHMGISEPTNTWWMDVLENGPSSQYALFFDIDWKPLKRELENKVLLPILGDQYGRVLERGELKLVFKHGIFTVRD